MFGENRLKVFYQGFHKEILTDVEHIKEGYTSVFLLTLK